eukprot:TCONS_00058445-protein
MNMDSEVLILLVVGCSLLIGNSHGKLTLNYWPKGESYNTVFVSGQTLLRCDVDSDRSFQLKWYKDGKELDFSTIKFPLWGFKFKDGSGGTLWQWPYHKDFLKDPAVFECRATNGVDPPVSKKVKFTPLDAHKLPADYPKKVDNAKQEKYPEKVFYGSNLTFYCDAKGGTNLDYQWFYNRLPLGKIDAKRSRAVRLDYKLSADRRILNIFNIQETPQQEAINFQCMVSNNVGLLNALMFSVATMPKPTPAIPPMVPRLTVRPQNVSVGGPEQWVEFDCAAVGHPTPLYWWYHDGLVVQAGAETGKVSVVAMRSGSIMCHPWNKYGSTNATAYLTVTPLPYRPNPIKIAGTSVKHITIEITPNYREAEWHPDIPVNEIIIQHRPYVFNQPVETAFNVTKFKTGGKPAPWRYTFDGLEPWIYIDFRVKLVNKYGVSNVSEWYHGQTDWGAITEPVRNLKATPLSPKSFRVQWEDPPKTNGPLTRYEFYYTTRPNADIKNWIMHGVDPTDQHYAVNWTDNPRYTEVAPVLYWKVRLVGFVNEGPFSETKAFKCLPGAPGFVTNVKLKVLTSRTIEVSWTPAENKGSGITGHDILFNRADIPKIERLWNIHTLKDPKENKVVVSNLLPNRPYEFKIYARTKESQGVPSEIVKTKTIEDAPSAPPQNVRGTAKHSQTLVISWDPPPVDHQNSPITGYTLYYSFHDRDPSTKEIGKND